MTPKPKPDVQSEPPMVITDALKATDDPGQVPTWLPWRVGRKVGRTLYAQVGDEPSDDDVLIGLMDSVVLAREAVLGHNNALRDVQRGPRA